MNAASVAKSKRLKRVLAVLNDGKEHTTRDLVVLAEVCAVNSIIAELRVNGYQIDCRRDGDVWLYRLTSSPPPDPTKTTSEYGLGAAGAGAGFDAAPEGMLF